MEQFILAFITGLTTGGLSCLAVQGSLLAGSLARQIEQDLLPKGASKKNQTKPNAATPILLFLFAKLVAYTILGALLGQVGAFLTLDPVSRAVLMLLIGIFMVGNALRMLNVHPFFRYFIIEPPHFIRRFIRQRAAVGGADRFTPLFLGALTVLIPCGVTQAMMAAALGTGNPLIGAGMMFAFTLGTSPVFFLVAYLATELGSRMEAYFLRFVAAVVLILGLITFENGLNLIGSPLSLNTLVANLRGTAVSGQVTQTPTPAAITPTPENPATETAVTLELNVLNRGYSPRIQRAPANRPVELVLVTDNTYSCARDFVIPALNYYQLLPETGRTSVQIPPQPPGTVLRFTCSMGMYTGQIIFEE